MYVYHLRGTGILNVAFLKAKIRKVRKIFDELAKNGFCNTRKKWNVLPRLRFFKNISKCLILYEYSHKIAISCFLFVTI